MTRDERGRFVKGNGGGPGRKPRAAEASYLDVTLGAVSLDDWVDIVVKAREQAKRGDAVARKWLSDWVLGLPVQKVETDNKGEVRLVVEHVRATDQAT